MYEMSSAVIGKICIMKLNTNAGPRTNRNILSRDGAIPDRILNRRYTGLGGRGYFATQYFSRPANLAVSKCVSLQEKMRENAGV